MQMGEGRSENPNLLQAAPLQREPFFREEKAVSSWALRFIPGGEGRWETLSLLPCCMLSSVAVLAPCEYHQMAGSSCSFPPQLLLLVPWALSVALREQVGNLLSQFHSVLVFSDKYIVTCFRHTNSQRWVSSMTLFHTATGFFLWPFDQEAFSLILTLRLFISQCGITAASFKLDFASWVSHSAAISKMCRCFFFTHYKAEFCSGFRWNFILRILALKTVCMLKHKCTLKMLPPRWG